MIKLPNFTDVKQSSITAFYRFPALIVAAFFTAGLTIALNHGHLKDDAQTLSLIATFILSFPLLIGTRLAFVGKGRARWWSRLIDLTLLVGVYFLLLEATELQRIYLFLHVALIFHLLVALSPFLANSNGAGFWHFNRVLLLRIFFGILNSAFLFASLAAAYLAVCFLFGYEGPNDFYLDLWLVIVFVFNTWYFAAGIPKDPQKPAADLMTPGLKVFAQFLLVPVVGVYLLILYAYLIKIGIQWEWPKGIVAWTVSVVSVLSVFSLLLLHPLLDVQSWVRRYFRILCVLLVPLAVLLLAALWRRYLDYGLTQNRYVLILCGLWILGIASFFTYKKEYPIELIPKSMLYLALFVLVGPWGVRELARSDQIRQIKTEIEKFHLLDETERESPPFKTVKKLNGSMKYLIERFGPAELDEIVGRKVTHLSQENPSRKPYLELLGLNEIEFHDSNYSSTFSFYIKDSYASFLRPYGPSKLFFEVIVGAHDSQRSVKNGSDQCVVHFDSENWLLRIQCNQGEKLAASMEPKVKKMVVSGKRWSAKSAAEMRFEIVGFSERADCYFERLSVDAEGDYLRFNDLRLRCLVSKIQ